MEDGNAAGRLMAAVEAARSTEAAHGNASLQDAWAESFGLSASDPETARKLALVYSLSADLRRSLSAQPINSNFIEGPLGRWELACLQANPGAGWRGFWTSAHGDELLAVLSSAKSILDHNIPSIDLAPGGAQTLIGMVDELANEVAHADDLDAATKSYIRVRLADIRGSLVNEPIAGAERFRLAVSATEGDIFVSAELRSKLDLSTAGRKFRRFLAGCTFVIVSVLGIGGRVDAPPPPPELTACFIVPADLAELAPGDPRPLELESGPQQVAPSLDSSDETAPADSEGPAESMPSDEPDSADREQRM